MKCAFEALGSDVGKRTEAHENAEILSSIVINFSEPERLVLDPHAAGPSMAGLGGLTPVAQAEVETSVVRRFSW